LTSNIKNLIYF